MVQRLLYKLLLKEILSHGECLSVCAPLFLSLSVLSHRSFMLFLFFSFRHTHSLSIGLPRCAMVQVYVFAGAHHYSNENDHCSSVFIHIQLRAPATTYVHVCLLCDYFFSSLFFFCRVWCYVACICSQYAHVEAPGD